MTATETKTTYTVSFNDGQLIRLIAFIGLAVENIELTNDQATGVANMAMHIIQSANLEPNNIENKELRSAVSAMSYLLLQMGVRTGAVSVDKLRESEAGQDPDAAKVLDKLEEDSSNG